MNPDEANASFSKANEWVEISIDSMSCVAGERLSGEILVQVTNNSSILSLCLRSKGIESVKVTETSGAVLEHSSNIYTLNTIIAESIEPGKIQSIYPFTFKLPVFSPSSFHFSDSDSEGNHISAQVSYEIEVILFSQSEDLVKCHKKFYVLNRNARKVLSGETSEENFLSCCWCCSRNTSVISLGYLDGVHCLCGGKKKFKISVESALNNKLESLMGQVRYELVVQIPGGKSFNVVKTLSRSVPDLNSIVSGSDNLRQLSLEIGIDFEQVKFGESPCSNDCALFGSEYKLQFYATYAVGCGGQVATCEMPIHVNPVTVLKEEIKVPSRWDPKEHLIANLILEASNGIPYPQGTVLFNRNKT